MPDDMKQKIEGTWDKVKGNVKQESDDPKTKAEGFFDEAKGHFKKGMAESPDEKRD